jgi:hypothetical protein
MFDMVVMLIPGIAILTLLWFRFCYMKSLTGLSSQGSVGVSYWGSYSSQVPDQTRLTLPTAKGVCPRCVSKSNGISTCLEHADDLFGPSGTPL